MELFFAVFLQTLARHPIFHDFWVGKERKSGAFPERLMWMKPSKYKQNRWFCSFDRCPRAEPV